MGSNRGLCWVLDDHRRGLASGAPGSQEKVTQQAREITCYDIGLVRRVLKGCWEMRGDGDNIRPHGEADFHLKNIILAIG